MVGLRELWMSASAVRVLQEVNPTSHFTPQPTVASRKLKHPHRLICTAFPSDPTSHPCPHLTLGHVRKQKSPEPSFLRAVRRTIKCRSYLYIKYVMSYTSRN